MNGVEAATLRRATVALGLAAVLALAPVAAGASELRLALTGGSSVVYNSARDACAPIDVPDVNPRAYRDASGGVSMFAMHFVNRALRGPDLLHLKLDCRVALDSPLDPEPSHYEDRNYIAATWTADGKAVSALVHHEYHADQHHRCRVADPLGCWFNSVLAYHSKDGGITFEKAKPLVVASAPFTQAVEQGRHRGFFNPSNMVADGGYVYAMASTTGWDGQKPGSCLFRTSDPSDSSLWRAYDGTGFTVRFGDPYTGATRPKPCVPIEPFLFPVGSIVRHGPSKTWIAIFQASPVGPFPVDGFYYATGRDLLHWSAPRLLLAGKTAYGDLCKVGPSIINYPAMLDPQSSSRNFDTIGDHPLLYFDVIQVANCETAERMLVHQALDLTWVADKP